MNYLLLLLLHLILPIYSTDVVFLIDSSVSIFDNDDCSHQNLIRNFTSNLVEELQECDINYASFQYNIRAYNDYSFSNNNTYVYNKMKHYTFKYGAPTVISYGLDKIIDLYKLENHTKPIFLILLTDGETLNKNDLHKALDVYPFNSSELNNVVIKIGTHKTDNQFVLQEFSNKSHYNILSCSGNPLTDILNNYNLCGFSTMTSTMTSTIHVNNTLIKDEYRLDKIYRIIIIIISSCIILFPCIALGYIFFNKTRSRIPETNNEYINDFYHYNNQPRIIQNSIYDIDANNDIGYVEVDGDDYVDQTSLDEKIFQTKFNYYKNNKTMTTDF